MARPKLDTQALATTERLLMAAEEEFGANGFEGARLSDIAERVGISRPSLLYHFESKQDLYEAVVRNAFLRLGESIAFDLDGPEPYAEKVVRAVEGFVEFIEARPSIARLLLRDVIDGRGPGHRMILEAGVPVLLAIESFIRRNGGERVRAFPIRQGLLQIVCAVLVRTATPGLRGALWGPKDESRQLALAMFVGGEA